MLDCSLLSPLRPPSVRRIFFTITLLDALIWEQIQSLPFSSDKNWTDPRLSINKFWFKRSKENSHISIQLLQYLTTFISYDLFAIIYLHMCMYLKAVHLYSQTMFHYTSYSIKYFLLLSLKKMAASVHEWCTISELVALSNQVLSNANVRCHTNWISNKDWLDFTFGILCKAGYGYTFQNTKGK